MWCAEDEPPVGGLRLLPAGLAGRLAGLAAALGDPMRLQMLHLLEQRDDLCTCHFQAILGLSQPKASYHLKILLDAGLVRREVRGTWSHYSLVEKGIMKRLAALAPAALAAAGADRERREGSA